MQVQDIRIEEYDYLLEDNRIAKYPLPRRDQSKLLLYRNGEVNHDLFTSLPSHLRVGSFLVFNNTKVIQARLRFRKETGAEVEIFCLEPHTPHDYALIFSQTRSCRWWCLVGNLKRWKEGLLSRTIKVRDEEVVVTARKVQSTVQAHEVEFVWDNDSVSFAELIEQMGELPIPPYLNRPTEKSDETTYQTIYSKIKGSVAAPTAGLHFTEEVFNALSSAGHTWEELTLHVGAGTFRPVKSEHIGDHEMHAETFSVSLEFLRRVKEHIGKIVAVGTTSVRTLESLYWIGVGLMNGRSLLDSGGSFHVDQWDPYVEDADEVSSIDAIGALIGWMEQNNRTHLHGSTQIIIVPGYRFRVVSSIITNFHQPRSTLLLLISAYLKGDWKRVYDYALANDFRFLSYGDSSLLRVDEWAIR